MRLWTVANDGIITIDNVGFLAVTRTVTFAVTAAGTRSPDVVTTYTVTIQASEKVAEETVNMTVTDSVGAEYDKIALTVTGNDYLANVDVSTSAGAARAVTILDKALDEISSSQAKLGAIQNRLQHNIDNLSNGSRLTETARGRIVDADFARETSELSKQQILGQAATSMLAQANQSKQSVLALLQ